jgi:hypothetical protein
MREIRLERSEPRGDTGLCRNGSAVSRFVGVSQGDSIARQIQCEWTLIEKKWGLSRKRVSF